MKEAIVRAFNRLGEHIPALEEESRVIGAELARLDETISNCPTDGEEDRKTALLETRAERAHHLTQIRFLLEVMRPQSDVLQTEEEASQPARKGSKKRSRAACWDEADFYRRTAFRPKEDVVRDGKVVRYDDGLVTRFVEKVTDEAEGLRVVFKAGVEIVIL